MSHATSATTRTFRILIVDDEPALLRSTCRLLEADGHTVFAAGDGAAALRIIAQQQVDIVMTDLNMPNMNGSVFLRQLREKVSPAPKVVLVSGSPWEGEPVKVDVTLAKPFTREELRSAVAGTYL